MTIYFRWSCVGGVVASITLQLRHVLPVDLRSLVLRTTWIKLLKGQAAMAKPFVDGQGEDVREAYEDIRNDSTENTWAAFTYEGKLIRHEASGTEYSEFLAILGDDARVYGYVRFETGDEMSRRAKFAFITWIGPNVGALKKGKVSTDKAFMKEIMTNFGKEILADEKREVAKDKVLAELEKASGAAYGTGH